MYLRLSSILLAAVLLGGCAATPQTAALLERPPENLERAVLLDHVPFYPQQRYQCGPAALATVLGASGLAATPAQLTSQVYVPDRQGSFQVEIMAAARGHRRLAYPLPTQLRALLSEVAAGHPVLVLQNLALSVYPRWHYAVVKGYDLERRELILNSGVEENYRLSLATFERTWQRADRWAMVALPPGDIPVSAQARDYFRAVVALQGTAGDETAGPALAAGLRRWPDNRELLMGYGNWLYGRDELARAAQRFRQVTERHPEYAPAWNNLAQVHFDQGRLSTALKLARRAVELGGTYQEDYEKTLAAIRASMDD